MRIGFLKAVMGLAAGLALPWSVSAAGFHFPVGFAYGYGIHEAADTLFDMYESTPGYQVDDRIEIPFGLTFNPYYELDNGLGFGLGLGPTAFIVVHEDFPPRRPPNDPYGPPPSEDHFSYAIPIGADIRYTLFRDKVVSPYVRVGFRFPIAGGDNIDSPRIGPFGAIGAEILRNKKIGLAVEIAYDGSEITLTGPAGQEKDVTFAGFMAGLSVVF